MADVNSICNMALYRTGVSSLIADIDEGSKESRVCKAFFEPTRDCVLEDVDWNFARKRQALALLSAGAPTNWTYAYALPDDCIAVRSIVVPSARVPSSKDRIPYEIQGRTLLTDWPDLELIYTYRCEDMSVWTPQAASALAWALVPELAMGLVIKTDAAQQGRAAYNQVISEAIASNLQQGSDNEPDSDFVTVR